jgi:hypothetical protein
MIFPLIGSVLIVVAFCAYVARVQRQHRLPTLHADWWPHFERQFRAHAMRVAQERQEP